MMAVDSLTFIFGRKLFAFVLVVNLWLNFVSMIFNSGESGEVTFVSFAFSVFSATSL